MKHLHLLPLLLLSFLFLGLAQPEETKSITGRLDYKKWSKTTESYCAQGADYYVLHVEGAQHVLQVDSKGLLRKLKRKVGSTVTLTGTFETKVIKKADQDPNSQQPADGFGMMGGGDFQCTVFKVSKVKK